MNIQVGDWIKVDYNGNSAWDQFVRIAFERYAKATSIIIIGQVVNIGLCKFCNVRSNLQILSSDLIFNGIIITNTIVKPHHKPYFSNQLAYYQFNVFHTNLDRVIKKI